MHKIWTWRVAVEPVIAVVRAVIDVDCKAASVVYWQWTAAMVRREGLRLGLRARGKIISFVCVVGYSAAPKYEFVPRGKV